jgi:hypothetical protein
MRLSESEARFVSKWQQQRRSWRWVRWVNLISSSILIVLAAWNLHRLLDLTRDGGGDTAAIGWFAPFAWLTLLAPSCWLGYTLGHWRGDIRTELLLRLIAEHEKDDA